jgi:hypothetical protein|tara:strand:- start:412 stop:816 length:405 start_codon:yes stop_codon:yes gene_type:complete
MDNKNNIFRAKASYVPHKIEETLFNLNDELQEQKELNNILSEKDFDKKTSEIREFISNNESDIDSYLRSLNAIFEELKTVVNDNKKLKENEKNYIDLLNSEDSKRIASKITQIKILKKKALLFLENANFTIPIK